MKKGNFILKKQDVEAWKNAVFVPFHSLFFDDMLANFFPDDTSEKAIFQTGILV